MIMNWSNTIPYHMLIADDEYVSGGYILPNNAADYMNPESGLYITVDNKRYIAYKSGIGEPFNKILDTSNANATAADIISGKTAVVDNQKIIGTIPDNGEINITPSTSSQSIPAGYTSGGTVGAVDSTIDENITATNIKKDVTILGVTGIYEGSGGEDIDLNVNDLTVEELQMKSNAFYTFSSMTVDPTITDLSGTFANTPYTIIPNINMINITNTSNLLSDCTLLMNIPNFDIRDVTDAHGMFYNCTNLIGAYNMGKSNVIDFDTSNVVNASDMFYSCVNMLHIPHINLSKATNLSNSFSECHSAEGVTFDDLSSATDMYHMFYNCYNITDVNLYNVTNAKNVSGAFENDIAMTNLTISNFSSVEDTSNMFYNCSNLVSVDINNWDTSHAVNMENMFYGCDNLSLESYVNIAYMLPNANQLTNQYCSNIGLNTSQFAVSELLYLEGKGYLDVESYKGNYVVEYS